LIKLTVKFGGILGIFEGKMEEWIYGCMEKETPIYYDSYDPPRRNAHGFL
jgi:hypothetical protein